MATNTPINEQSVRFVTLPDPGTYADSCKPPEGPRAAQLPPMDFSLANSFVLDLEQSKVLKRLTQVLMLFIDMQGIAQNLQVQVGTAGNDAPIQTILAKANTQGYYRILCPSPTKLTFLSPQAAGVVIQVALCNVAVTPSVWPTV